MIHLFKLLPEGDNSSPLLRCEIRIQVVHQVGHLPKKLPATIANDVELVASKMKFLQSNVIFQLLDIRIQVRDLIIRARGR